MSQNISVNFNTNWQVSDVNQEMLLISNWCTLSQLALQQHNVNNNNSNNPFCNIKYKIKLK